MQREYEYKGWRIEVTSYRPEEGKWRPDVRVWTSVGGTAHEQHLVAPTHRLFETEQQSDAWGQWLAAEWINNHG